LCGRKGHTVLKCYKRFDHNFTGEDKSVSSVVASSYEVDTNWYANSSATDHIMANLEKLTTRDKYMGQDQVHTASGSGMKINQVGNSIIHTSSRDLCLNNILYVPKGSKNLISIHHFTCDNQIFFELHPLYFLIKDRTSRKVLHQSKVEKGLYPLKSLEKQVFGVIKPSRMAQSSRSSLTVNCAASVKSQ
jgi:hypothetical protein